MLIDSVYYGLRKINFIYKNGEVIWYVGDILPLDFMTTVDVLDDLAGVPTLCPVVDPFGGATIRMVPGSITDGGLSYIPIVCLDSYDFPNVRAYCENHGTSLRAISTGVRGAEFVSTYQDADIRVVPARLGSHEQSFDVTVYGLATGIEAFARLGSLEKSYHITLTERTTAIEAHAKMGALAARYDVAVYGRATGVGAVALLGSEHKRYDVVAYNRSTGVSANAVQSSLRGRYDVVAYNRSTGVSASAKSGHADHSGDVVARNFNSGIVATASMASSDALSAVRESRNATLAFPYVALLNGSALLQLSDVVEGNAREFPAALLNGKSTSRAHVVVEGSITPIPGIRASAREHTVLENTVNGSLTHGVSVVSAGAEHTIPLYMHLDAHLSDWKMPVVAGENLYVRQAYTSAQVGNKLILSENEISNLLDKSVDANADCAILLETMLDAHLSEWLMPIADGNNLYVPQAYEATQHETNLYMSDWLWPHRVDNNVHIQQVYTAEQDGSVVVLL